MKEEIKLLSDVFRNINGYPRKIIDRCHREIKEKFSTHQPTVLNIEASKDPTEVANNSYMLLPYAGPRGEKVLEELKKRMPEKLRPKIVYNGTKISSYFPVKDKIDIMHCSDVVYYYESNAENIKDD